MTEIGSSNLSTPHIRHDPVINVAFVNNTSDRGLGATETQFLRLVRQMGTGLDLRITYFTCPEIRRTDRPRSKSGRWYADTSELLTARADALIVTGMEPVAVNLRDEPVWHSLTDLVCWAEHHAVPSIWSCLAAHAAVLHMDGIDRIRYPTKLSDVFSCEFLTSDMPLMHNLPPRWSVPHSRYYGLPEAALIGKGYQLLSRSTVAGADLFMKEGRAPFLFFQGHPEYDDNTLLLEYRRDIRRYFSGERDEYPVAPSAYFGQDVISVLSLIRAHVLETRKDPDTLHQVLDIARTGSTPIAWSDPAASLYANWLSFFVLERGWRKPFLSAQVGTTMTSFWQGSTTMPQPQFIK